VIDQEANIMTKNEEARLAAVARTAKNLRESADNAKSMLAAWSRHKSKAGEIYLSLSDRRDHRWHTGVHLPVEAVQRELVPILKRIRDEALAQLAALELP
jgi:hypothetical protein